GSHLLRRALAFGEPSAGQVLDQLAADPRLGVGQGRLKASSLWRMAYFAVPVLVRFGRNLLFPDQARDRFESALAAQLNAAQIAPADEVYGRLANVVVFIQEHVATSFPRLVPR